MNQGTHSDGNITLKAGTRINERYLFGALVKGKITPVSKGCRAIAVITDCGAEDDYVNVQFMGSNAGTMKVLAAGTIEAGEHILSNHSGKAVSLLDQDPGSYQICGIALTSATTGQCVEFTPTLGLELTQ